MSNYRLEIKDKIDGFPKNTVFIANDFFDIADYETVRKNLNRMVEKGEIKRVLKGIYYKPRYIEIIDEYEMADTNEVAKAIARKHHWTIAPSGNTALNLLGLSTQIPSKWIYISDGRYVDYMVGNTTITFKKTRNNEISQMSTLTATVIQAIKAIGKEHVTEKHIELLREGLDRKDRLRIVEESKMTTTWIYRIIKKLGEPN
ncbi:hypothetical protein TP70_01390 [Staphylococcus microti]|uniref:Transcriptional regulator, AbiEi antitoxin, Type IV TA system n=1 Tax=Staphylococcus microti TaxID=569857 RepID=A0A0D6XUU8_9STAP|nr:DUF6088 family protein [Staphylococcus microti]KIX91623.1 hypothetical protein TP70_01390 [Staphylococcus microti]PNZ82427.1 hypothetical protein CD132_03795 [Staphylococcus microti]SUM57329.1 Uncharacterised protein [Staphylococcus microti]